MRAADRTVAGGTAIRVGWRTWASIYVRILVLQAAWSYRRLQTIGWLWAALPVVRLRAPADPERLLARLVIHFNTHPFFAPLVIGAALEALVRIPDDDEAIEVAVKRLGRWMGSLGALGDTFYWQYMSRFVGVWLLAGWLLAGTTGLLASAGLWLLTELSLRAWLLAYGLRHPTELARILQPLTQRDRRVRLDRWGWHAVGLGLGVTTGLALEHGVPGWGALVGAFVGLGLAVRGPWRFVLILGPMLFEIGRRLLQW